MIPFSFSDPKQVRHTILIVLLFFQCLGVIPFGSFLGEEATWQCSMVISDSALRNWKTPGTSGMLGIKYGSAGCKANALSALLSLWPSAWFIMDHVLLWMEPKINICKEFKCAVVWVLSQTGMTEMWVFPFLHHIFVFNLLWVNSHFPALKLVNVVWRITNLFF